MALPAGIGSPIHPALPSPFPYTPGRINHSFWSLLCERFLGNVSLSGDVM